MVTEVPCNEVSWVYEGFFRGKGNFLLFLAYPKETLIFSEINSTSKTGIRKKNHSNIDFFL